MKAHYQAVSGKEKIKTSRGAKTNGAEENGWMCDEAVRRGAEGENESAAVALALCLSKDRCFPKINIPTQSLFICVIPTLTG